MKIGFTAMATMDDIQRLENLVASLADRIAALEEETHPKSPPGEHDSDHPRR